MKIIPNCLSPQETLWYKVSTSYLLWARQYIQSMKKNIWFLDHNFKFSKDTNPKFGPENANEIYYYCPKYQTQTPPKMAFYQNISKIIKV